MSDQTPPQPNAYEEHRILLSVRSIFENATIGIFRTTPEGRFEVANPALASMFGYASPQELIDSVTNIPQQLYFEPEHRAEVIRLLNGGQTKATIETRYRRKDGGEIIGNLNMWAIRDTDGYVCYLEGFVEDVTERKQAEYALRQSEARFRTIINTIKDGLALLDNNGNLISVNKPFAALFHSTPEELVEQSWLNLCQSITPPFPGTLALRTLHDAQPRFQRVRFTKTSQYDNLPANVRILDIQTLPLLNSQHILSQVVMHIIDMTDHVQLETLVIQNERFAASGKLAATVAHEVNTPLQAMRNFLYLAGQAEDEQRTNYIALIRDEIDRISSIIQQFLNLYRPDNSSISDIDINVLMERVMLLTQSTLTKHRITLERRLLSELPLIHGRADQLTQVFLNLIMNAIDAMPHGGTLTLRTSADTIQDMVIVEVSDTGTGILPIIETRIFEPFFTTKPQGTGLGLAISRRIIEQHNGRITIQNNVEQGSTCILTLPTNRKK